MLVIPLLPLSKLPAIQLSGTTLNGREGEVSTISQRRETSSDLKQKRLVFCQSISTFLQLVVAHCYKTGRTKIIAYPNSCLATASIVDVFPVPGGP